MAWGVKIIPCAKAGTQTASRRLGRERRGRGRQRRGVVSPRMAPLVLRGSHPLRTGALRENLAREVT